MTDQIKKSTIVILENEVRRLREELAHAKKPLRDATVKVMALNLGIDPSERVLEFAKKVREL